MAKLAVLLCLALLLLVAVYARDNRQEIIRGRPQNAVSNNHPNHHNHNHNNHPNHPNHNNHHHNNHHSDAEDPMPFGGIAEYSRQRLPSHSTPTTQHGSHRPTHHGRGRGHGRGHGRAGAWPPARAGHGILSSGSSSSSSSEGRRNGVHGMALNFLKATEHAIGRLPHHRLMETIRDQLHRYRMAGRGQGHRQGQGHGHGHSQGQGQGRRNRFREIARRFGRPHRAGGMRGHGLHHPGNDLRGHGRMGRGHHAMHMGHHAEGHHGRGNGMGPRYSVL